MTSSGPRVCQSCPPEVQEVRCTKPARARTSPGRGRPLDPPHDLAPWLPQTTFSALLVLDVLLRWLGGNPVALLSWPALAVVVAVLASLASVAVPWRRVPVGLVCVLPVVDLGVVGLARLDAQVGGAGVLAVIPALWLGAVLGRRGAVVALVASLVLMVVPGFLYLGTSMPVVTRSLLIPVVAVASALAIAAALEQARSGLEEARRKQVQLARRWRPSRTSAASRTRSSTPSTSASCCSTPTAPTAPMNRRHRGFMALAYPDGHAGRAGQLGHVYATADGTTPLTREEMPTYRASQGEEFDDQPHLDRPGPAHQPGACRSRRAPVRDEDGTFAGAALAYKDVTDFMRALRVKDEFVASVSHELRTPLTSIVGYVLLLQERDGPAPDVLKQLDVVARNTDRLQRLVADLLHTAQVDEGPMQVVRTPHRPGADRAGRRGRGHAHRRGGRASDLEVDVPRALDVLVDAQRMAQVVDNLLSNAIKYTPGGGEVGVRLRRRRQPGRAARQRHRHRHRGRRPRPAVHPVLPRPARRGAVDPGRRARAEHHQGDRREPRRPDRGGQRDRPGQHVPGPAPARRQQRHRPRRQRQSGQVPKISRVWLTSAYPCSAAIALGPALDGRALHLDGGAAGAADQVVVVRVGAAAVDRLAVLGAQQVDLAGLGQPLQGPVDRGQADGLAASPEQLVDLLRGAEVGEGAQGLDDRAPLPGRAQAGAWAQCSS